MRYLKSLISSNPSISSTQISKDPIFIGNDPSTIRKRFLKLGYRSYVAKKKQILSKYNKKRRLEWCKEHKDKDVEFWKGVLFTDETLIELQLSNYAMYRVRRLSDMNPYQPQFVRQCIKNPIKIMIWGSFSFSGVKGFKIIDGYMNGQKYIETLEDTFKNS